MLIEASAELTIGEKGAQAMSYTAKYRQGPSDVTFRIDTTINIPEETTLSKSAPVDADSYVLVDFALIPQIYFRAIKNYEASSDRSDLVVDMCLSQAAGAMLYSVSSTDMSKENGSTLLKNDITYTFYTSEDTTTEEYSMLYKDGMLTETIDGETAEAKVSESVMSEYAAPQTADYYAKEIWINTAEMSTVGDGILLEFTMDGNKEAESYYRQLAATGILGNNWNVLDRLASDYTTNKLSAYMGIDLDT